jgi:syntaxin-binding protein 5
LLFVGTNQGRFITFKLLPEAPGRYAVKLAGSTTFDQRIISVSPVNAETGTPASATQEAVASLRTGAQVNGVVIVVTQAAARVFKPASAKGANKAWDEYICYSAAVVRYQAYGHALLGLFGDGCAKIFSLPALKEIASGYVANVLDVRRFADAIITPTGDICGWTGPSEIAMINVWGAGDDLYVYHDRSESLANL